MSNVGAVIVTYNSEEVIAHCLEACRRHGVPAVVVDNCSHDRTVEILQSFPEVTLTANPSNRGFAAAVNQGVASSQTAHILLLNPDVEILTGVQELSTALDAGAGAAAGRLVDSAGRVQAGFNVRSFPSPLTLCFEVLGINRLWKSNPVNRRYRCRDLGFECASDVDQPAGAFLMFSRAAWSRLGGFDESFYPLWFEDVDFCLRLRSCGYRIVYEPSVVGKHVGGHSVDTLPRGCREGFWYGSLLRYALKHFSPAGRRAVCTSVTVGALLRMIVLACKEASPKPFSVYGKVIGLAVKSWVSASPAKLEVFETGPVSH